MFSALFILLIHATLTANSALNMPTVGQPTASQLAVARSAMKFIDRSPSPNHCVLEASLMLQYEDFVRLDERESWESKIEAGGKYFFTREGEMGTSLVAFAVGAKFESGGEGGFKILGAHTDSPNLRVKPRSKRKGSGCTQINVETYGGGLWHTWFDRDLSVAGKVILKRKGGDVETVLVDLERPLLRIPNLAIHLQTPSEREAFKVNKEDHMQPILALEVEKSLTGGDKEGLGDGQGDGVWRREQEPLLFMLLAEKLGVEASEIVDFELSLYDCQKGSFCGATDEFINSARLDNQMGCFVSLASLVNHASSAALDTDLDVSLVALFDHEEVGSDSTVGAGSTLIDESFKRVALALAGPNDAADSLEAMKRRSFCVSFDMAHAIHPNYSAKHEKNHAPKLNQGVVIKSNSNQRYATTGATGFLVRELGRSVGQDVQEVRGLARNESLTSWPSSNVINALLRLAVRRA